MSNASPLFILHNLHLHPWLDVERRKLLSPMHDAHPARGSVRFRADRQRREAWGRTPREADAQPAAQPRVAYGATLPLGRERGEDADGEDVGERGRVGCLDQAVLGVELVDAGEVVGGKGTYEQRGGVAEVGVDLEDRVPGRRVLAEQVLCEVALDGILKRCRMSTSCTVFCHAQEG